MMPEENPPKRRRQSGLQLQSHHQNQRYPSRTPLKKTQHKPGDTTTINIDSDSLPDPFAPKEMTPKMSGTKEDQSAENIQEEMDTMLELISDDDNDAPPKSFSTKDPT